jgi:Subtilase family
MYTINKITNTSSTTTGSITTGKSALGQTVVNTYNAAHVLLEQTVTLSNTLAVKYFLVADGSYTDQIFSNGYLSSSSSYSTTNVKLSTSYYSKAGIVSGTDTFTYNTKGMISNVVKVTPTKVDNIAYTYSASNLLSTLVHTNAAGQLTETDYYKATGALDHIVMNVPAVIPPPTVLSTVGTWSNIAGYGEVDYIKALNIITGGNLTATVPTGNVSWSSIATHTNDVVTAGFTGKGIVIADINTGIDLRNTALTHSLSSYNWNFLTNTSNVQDDNSHGSEVASLITATNIGNGVTGNATGAQLMVLKALDANNNGTLANIVSAIDYAVDHGANVINLSLGVSSVQPAILTALQYAQSHNVLVSIASGNDGGNTPVYPAAYAQQLSNVVAVGATANGVPNGATLFASYADKTGTNTAYNYVDAPGSALTGYNDAGVIVTSSGTSLASALVASEMAVLLQAYNSISGHVANSAAAISSVISAITHGVDAISLTGIAPIPSTFFA